MSAKICESLTDIASDFLRPRIAFLLRADKDEVEGHIRWGDFQVVVDATTVYQAARDSGRLPTATGPFRTLVDCGIYLLAKEIVRQHEARESKA